MAESVGERFAEARTAWLSEAATHLAADERIGAVLVAGSLGRGTADNWSDIDLVVVIGRDAAGDVLAKREEFVRRYGAAVFVFDSPWNAPLDCAQVNALYDVGSDWPLYVDWDLWPADRGAISPDVRVVLDRVGLPVVEAPFDDYRSWPRPARPELTPADLRRARLAMLPIIAKCLVRGDVERAHRMLSNLGCEADQTATDLLEATRTMWRELRSDTSEPFARSIERMLRVTSQAVTQA